MVKEEETQNLIDSVDGSNNMSVDENLSNILTKQRNDENGLPI